MSSRPWDSMSDGLSLYCYGLPAACHNYSQCRQVSKTWDTYFTLHIPLTFALQSQKACQPTSTRLEAVLASFEAEKGTATGGLGGIQGIAWGARQARVVDPGDEGVAGQGLGQEGTVACLRLHAQRHGLQAPQAQPAVKGAQDSALSILHTPGPKFQARSTRIGLSQGLWTKSTAWRPKTIPFYP